MGAGPQRCECGRHSACQPRRLRARDAHRLLQDYWRSLRRLSLSAQALATVAVGAPERCAATPSCRSPAGKTAHLRATLRAGFGPACWSMRRASLSWLLSLLLVLVQHGAVLHELGHLRQAGGGSGPVLQTDLHPAGTAGCPTCEAYAQIANPVVASTHDVAVLPAALLRTPPPGYTVPAVDVPTPRSRGPPQV